MGNKDKDKNKDHEGDSTFATAEKEARNTVLAQTIAKAVSREMAKTHVHYTALLHKRSTAIMPTSVKISSGANGFKVMDPFDWTKDKAIYQRWQLWSEKDRLTVVLLHCGCLSLIPFY